MKCIRCKKEMDKFITKSELDGYFDCGNECHNCQLIIWIWKITPKDGDNNEKDLF